MINWSIENLTKGEMSDGWRKFQWFNATVSNPIDFVVDRDFKCCADHEGTRGTDELIKEVVGLLVEHGELHHVLLAEKMVHNQQNMK
jgi:hypothetical protein